MKKLLRVRDVVLRVNEEYIRSAAQADAYRTEPPSSCKAATAT